ncbi:hypothetical protein OOT46_26525 [Aquabacterium sp. A7-Y]|uniref:hypothetical protein n=1 Tax=Aquabacterium sp. A7-Y TaxID=1349605 RepID=UPI00223E7F02|nr:hypothetical protein [Aquabacterium sp. A7-Y]MCW7541372.1 hypothetical protein [Aquabacterium sp. A7-Y]
MTQHPLAWTAPPPFWTDSSGRVVPHGDLARPQILRFATDDFMPELLSLLEHEPSSLAQYAVFKETWRGPAGAPAADARRWLQREPKRLLGVRRASSKRAPAVGTASLPLARNTAQPLKLYQPAHLRHYLVSGSLVCRTPGLPDRQVDPARHKVSFVVRRLFPKTTVPPPNELPDPADTDQWDEHAFLPKGQAGAWHKVGTADSERAAALLPGEERLAMFPSAFVQDDGRPRRLYVGSVPVGRREAYQAASQAPVPGGAQAPMDPRLALFHTQVLAPWKALVNRVMLNGPTGEPESPAQRAAWLKAARPEWVFANTSTGFDRNAPDVDALRATRSGVQTASWYLLLDLSLYLKEQLKSGFWDVVQAGGVPVGPARSLYDALSSAAMPGELTSSSDSFTAGPARIVGDAYREDEVELNLIEALKRIVEFESVLESARGSFEIPSASGAAKPAGWPDFLFLFADPWFGVLQPPEPDDFNPPTGDYLAEKIQARIHSLAGFVEAALPPLDGTRPLPEPALATMTPADLREAWYVMRLVYERPDCAPFHGTVVSAATQPFQMAGFFDPDAPARPIRIGLPLDISPAGLRKFDKNTAFMLSDMLCGQIDRMKGIGLGDLVRSVLPWPLHKDLNVPEKGDCKTSDGLSLGVMCSLSIPIVTICALLLVMIIVSLLDFIFRWLPYFIVCFPLPGFKGRKEP